MIEDIFRQDILVKKKQLKHQEFNENIIFCVSIAIREL